MCLPPAIYDATTMLSNSALTDSHQAVKLSLPTENQNPPPEQFWGTGNACGMPNFVISSFLHEHVTDRRPLEDLSVTMIE